jgi:Ser/Thr protein kinase RdoA (MazF antagonist)
MTESPGAPWRPEGRPRVGRPCRRRDRCGRAALHNAVLTRLLEDYGTTTAEIDDCGLPPVLVHGDAHAGNGRTGTREPVWFDWGDSTLGHLLLDLAVLRRARQPVSCEGSPVTARSIITKSRSRRHLGSLATTAYPLSR